MGIDTFWVRTPPPGLDVRGAQEVRSSNVGNRAALPNQKQILAEPALTNSRFDDGFPLGSRQTLELDRPTSNVVRSSQIVRQLESELTRFAGALPESGRQDLAIVLKRSVVDVAVEQMHLLTTLMRSSYAEVGSVTLLAFPVETIPVQKVLVLGQALLLLPGHEENDVPASGRCEHST